MNTLDNTCTVFQNKLAEQFEEKGWKSNYDFQWVTPEGQTLFSSNLYLTKGNHKIAVMIEPVVEDEDEEFYYDDKKRVALRKQQQKVFSSLGIRGLWFSELVDDYAPESRCNHDFNVPFFLFKIDDETNEIVILEHLGRQNNYTTDLNINEFLTGLLETKDVRWSLRSGQTVTLTPMVKRRDCWKCQNPSYYIVYVAINTTVNGDLVNLDNLEIKDFPQSVIDSINQNNKTQRNLIGELKKRYSKTVGEKYMSNGCCNCGALFGDFFVRHGNFEPCESFNSFNHEIKVDDDFQKFGHWVNLNEEFNEQYL